MDNLIDVLEQRGFIERTTHDEELREYVGTQRPSCYIGFDPTASSLHIGSLVPIMALAHAQRCGLTPIALVGGGTGLVGDPSGKTEMRKLLTEESLGKNALGIKKQLSRFIDFADAKAVLCDNADWLKDLGYIAFLRDIGRHFSVNRMVKAESYRMRLESEEGLNFIEFNYMLLQAYDFLKLFDSYTCRLQMGGSDQWGNIVAGLELVRRMRRENVFGVTFPLITTSSGAKMGKTEKGAVWLDSERTSPYEYYQYWINSDDRDVARFASLFTFLPKAEIEEIRRYEAAELNSAKAVLAFEATKLAHGQAEAFKACQASSRVFGERTVPKEVLPSSGIHSREAGDGDGSVPQSSIDTGQLESGIPAFKIFQMSGLAGSSSSARRLIIQGGAYINGERVSQVDYLVTGKDLKGGGILLRSGKKRYHKLIAK